MHKTSTAFGILLSLAGPVLGAAVTKISQDATCGIASGATCQGSVFGNCCSRWGYCGSSNIYCGAGCQSDFGTCDGVTPPTGLKVSEDATCGKDTTCIGSGFGDCCSSSGWCGSTKDYCGAGCQSPFGRCDVVASSVASATASGSAQLSLSPSSSSGQAMSSSATVSSTSAGTSTSSSAGASATSSSGTASAVPTSTSSTTSAASSRPTGGIRIYEERNIQWQAPACNYLVADKRVQNIVQEPRSAAIAECQARCDAYPGCLTFFLNEDNPRVRGAGVNKMYCALGARPWNPNFLQCNVDGYQYSTGYEYVRTDGGQISASGSGASSSSSSSTTSSSSSSSTTSSSTRTTSSTSFSSSVASSTTSTSSTSSSATTTGPAAPSASVRSVRVYERRNYQPNSPACASFSTEVLTIRGLDSNAGPNKDYATGVAQCQGMCNALPGCLTFFYSRQDGRIDSKTLAECALGKFKWRDNRISCDQPAAIFSAGYELVRTDTVTVTLGATSTGSSSTVAP